jgi:mevalonate pyrophosphate decarboxylase
MAARETSMTPIRWTAFVVGLGLAAQASAASPIAQLKGRWAFDWAHDPAKAKCQVVDGQLLKDFQSAAYVCEPTETKTTTTGAMAADCRRSQPYKDYLIFRTKALCEAERLAQAANGD